MTPLQAVHQLAKDKLRIDKSRIGRQIHGYQDLLESVERKQSIVCPMIGSIHPAAWVINMNYSVVCSRIQAGLFVYLKTKS